VPSFLFVSPPISVGVSKLYVDLFNAAGSGTPVDVRSVRFVPRADAAVTGAVAVRGDLFTTSAAGTGGTAAIRDTAASTSPDPAGGSITKFGGGPNLPAQITIRTAPTGGATIARWVRQWQVFVEETNPATLIAHSINWVPCDDDGDGSRWEVPEGSGILVRQGTVLSVGSVSVVIRFRI
jgi:hypothetical protein